MDKEFIVYAETKASFEAAVNSGDVDTSQIGIIGETGELWENGEYHPLVESISLARDLTGREEATAEEFIFRASGGNKSIRDESAVIRRIKGNTLVWNQRIANPNFADGTLRWSANNGSLAVNANGSVRFTHTHTGSQSVSQTFTERIPSGHKVLVVMDYQRGDNTAISSLVYLHKASNGYDRFGFPRIGSNARRVEACIITTTDEIRGIMAYPFLNAPVGAYSDIYSINVFDLTQMFGAGNEPSGVSEFKTLFPESCYPYSAPEVRAMRASGIETIGANAFNKEDVVGGVINVDDGTVTSNDIYSVADIEVLGNGRYTLTNVANSALTRASYTIYDNDYRLILTGGFADSVRLQLAMSGSVSLPENARYMRVVVHNDYLDSCCVNITHSGALSDATYFKDVRMLPDIIKYFPDGMHSVGDVYDEINAENAIKRCGVRAYEDGDSANGDVITDGATTVYALEEPIMIPIVDALQLDYNVADYGTEKMLSTQPSTPFRADIVYKFNAVDRIRDNARNIERLEEMMESSGGSGIDAEAVEQLILANTDSEVKADGVKPVSGEAVSNAIVSVTDKTASIETKDITDKDDEIIIENNDGVQVIKITASVETVPNSEQRWESNDGTEVFAKIDENGIDGKVSRIIPAITIPIVVEPDSDIVDEGYASPIGRNNVIRANWSAAEKYNYYEFLARYYDCYLGEFGNYSVTKRSIGSDSSNSGYELFEYDFCPLNYKKVVMISAGMNTCETGALWGLATFIKAMMTSDEEGFAFLRKNVRFKVLPMICPSSFDKATLAYHNANGVRINKNFDYRRNWYDVADSTKGEYPDSEVESRILKTWINDNAWKADLYIDCHQDPDKHEDQVNDLTVVICSDSITNNKLRECFPALVQYYRDKGYISASVTPNTYSWVETGTNYPKTKYAKEICGIPSIMIEQYCSSTMYGSDGNTINDVVGIKNYVTMLRLYIFAIISGGKKVINCGNISQLKK